LDFTNTINSRHRPEHDYLTRYSDLLGWVLKAGMSPARQIYPWQGWAEQNSEAAEEIWRKAVTIRELLYRIFSAVARQSEPDASDTEWFVELLADAITPSQLMRKTDQYAPDWDISQSGDAVLWPVIYSASQLLLSQQLAQLKECPGCGWLFLDTSKNRSRRWCSMNTCGARDKMRRYHSKLSLKDSSE